MAFGSASERHADLVTMFKAPEEAVFMAARTKNPNLIYSGTVFPPFDSPQHVRAIVSINPNETVIGVRPWYPSMFMDEGLVKGYQEINDMTLESFFKRAEKMTNKPLYITTGITNADLDRGIETMSVEHLDLLRRNKQLWKVDSKFFRDYQIIGGVPQKIPRRK